MKSRKKTMKMIKMNKTLKFKKLNCTQKPNNSKNTNKFSCYANTSLFKIQKIWNKKYPSDKINSKNPKKIWNFIKEKFKNICDKESCWLKQKFIRGNVDSDLIDSFSPKIPERWKTNPNEWLSSVDILEVLNKYEKTYPDFEFIGPSPIDFYYRQSDKSCVCNKLCNFNLKEKIKNKINKIGIIFNLDPHDKGGSHWVSLFLNIPKHFIFYFDSTGEPIPKEIFKLVEEILKQGKQLNPPIYFKFDQNSPKEHQFGNTECGVYSLFFIINLLMETKTPDFFKIQSIKDNEIEKYRKIYFNEDL
jgi:hypothetical protein